MHMPIAYGPVTTKKVSEDKLVESNQVQPSVPHVTVDVCLLCHQNIKEYALSCLKHDCQSMFHVICLAKQFCGNVDNEQIIPITGNCPACDTFLLWGDLVRNKIVISNRLELNNSCSDLSG